MGKLEIKHCEICGKLFQPLSMSICPSCIEQADAAFQIIRDYIYDAEGNVDVSDIHEHTEVPEKIILYLIKEGRLTHEVAALKGYLSCAACGEPIDKGKLCAKCSAVWSIEKSRPEHKQQVKEKSTKAFGTGRKMHTYHSKGS